MAAQVDLRRLRPLVRRIGLSSRAGRIRALGECLTLFHRGRVPVEYDELVRLPGVGLYSAAVVRIVSFSKPDFPVDGNVFRFVSRYLGVGLRGTKLEARQVREGLMGLVPRNEGGEWFYGLLDFAAKVCRKRAPQCQQCPLGRECAYSKVEARKG